MSGELLDGSERQMPGPEAVPLLPQHVFMIKTELRGKSLAMVPASLTRKDQDGSGQISLYFFQSLGKYEHQCYLFIIQCLGFVFIVLVLF